MATNSEPMYLFTAPTFKTEESCRSTLIHKPSVESYIIKLDEAYNGNLPGPIKGVNCIPQQLVDQLQHDAGPGMSI